MFQLLSRLNFTGKLIVSLVVLGSLCGISINLMQQPSAQSIQAIRIMPLGDSITQGNTQYNSYRRGLWLQLREAGYNVDFVGSQRSNFEGPAPSPDFDLDHEGHWGWRVDEILQRLPGWAAVAQPDIVLIHLGTNDIAQNQSIASTTTEVRSLIQTLRTVNPRVQILVAQIIPLWGAEAQMQQLNTSIAQLATELNTTESPIITVDQFTGFNPLPSKHTYDGCHPNAVGEAIMADRWFTTLKTVLPQPVPNQV